MKRYKFAKLLFKVSSFIYYFCVVFIIVGFLSLFFGFFLFDSLVLKIFIFGVILNIINAPTIYIPMAMVRFLTWKYINRHCENCGKNIKKTGGLLEESQTRVLFFWKLKSKYKYKCPYCLQTFEKGFNKEK